MGRVGFVGIALLVMGCTTSPGAATSPPVAPSLSAPPIAVITPGSATATPMSTVPAGAGSTTTPAPPITTTPTAASQTAASQTATPTTPGPTCLKSPILTVREFLDADPDCLGGWDVSIRAWADDPFATGWEAPYIEPAWLAYPPDGISMLWGVQQTEDEHTCSEDLDPACGAMFVYVRPGSGRSLGDTPGWVIATGHVRDAAAATCRYVVGDDWPGDPPDDASARAECRGHFVLTEVSS